MYRKYVLHLLKYRFAVYLSRSCSTDLREFFGHSVGNVSSLFVLVLIEKDFTISSFFEIEANILVMLYRTEMGKILNYKEFTKKTTKS